MRARAREPQRWSNRPQPTVPAYLHHAAGLLVAVVVALDGAEGGLAEAIG